jgi:Fur family transcriptional regulator, ferric uptake regulator
MTVPALGPSVPVDNVEAAFEALRARGLRLSAARRLVLETLAAAEAPLTAEQAAAGVSGRVPSSDLASVYRNLETLEELGLVRHVHLGHGPGLYALARADEREYLVCEACEAVRAVPGSELDPVRDVIRAAFGFEARFTHFPIVGRCPDCAARAVGDAA